MLNTDAHSAQVKSRMTKADFLKNNRGISDGADLPEEFLGSIYDDIVHNEIRMKDEVEAVILNTNAGLAGALANVGRDLQKEAYVLQSNGMANKTEVSFLLFASLTSLMLYLRPCSGP
jgi:brefeldin A-inhibited guanine nucleotide-exchange protein